MVELFYLHIFVIQIRKEIRFRRIQFFFPYNNSQKLDSSRVFRLELLKGIRSFSPTRRTFAKKKEKKKAKDGRGKRGKSRRRIAGVKEESGRCFDRGTLQLSILGSTRKCIGRRETCG